MLVGAVVASTALRVLRIASQMSRVITPATTATAIHFVASRSDNLPEETGGKLGERLSLPTWFRPSKLFDLLLSNATNTPGAHPGGQQ